MIVIDEGSIPFILFGPRELLTVVIGRDLSSP